VNTDCDDWTSNFSQMIHDTPADTKQPSPAEQLQKPVTTLLRPGAAPIDEQNLTK
jgi:hypothetical protein